MHRKISRALMLSTSASLCLSATSAMAEGTRIVLQTWNPASERPDGLQTLVERREGLETMVRTAWDAARGQACDQIKQQIPGRVMANDPDASVPANEIICDIGPASNVVLTDAGQRLTTTITAPNNTVRLKVVYKWPTPDAFVTVPFSLTGTINARSGVPGRLLTLDSASVIARTGTVKVEGASLAADFVLKVADLVGVDVAALVKKEIGAQKVELDQIVTVFNDTMTRASRDAVAKAVSVRMWRTGGITLFALTPSFPPMPRGPISGLIVASTGMPDCGGITLSSTARGPGTLMRPFSNPPFFTAGPPTTSSATKSVGGQSQAPNQGVASERRCPYRIADAPVGGASMVTASGYSTSLTGATATLDPYEQPARVSASNVNFNTFWGRNRLEVSREVEAKIKVKVRDYGTPGPTRPQARSPVTRTAPKRNRTP